MPKLIDAERLLKYIRSAPAQSAAPRDSAFWEDLDSETVFCSRCYSEFDRKECEDFLYCPICGRILAR